MSKDLCGQVYVVCRPNVCVLRVRIVFLWENVIVKFEYFGSGDVHVYVKAEEYS